MREILFHGKRADNGEWVEGDVLQTRYHSGHIEYQIMPQTPVSSAYPVLSETVGQYTGLTDKNGKRIFEGDIVECWSEGVKACGTVQQRIDGLWIIYPAWQKRIMWGLCPDNDGNTTVEIVGNIHDNPELME